MGAHHHHGHHHHDHPHASGAGGGRRLLVSIVLNLVITVAEVVGGVLSGSLALLSDALHNFSDTASLAIAYTARRIARREATSHRTFGYRRAEIVGAFVNLITLVLIALYLMKEAVERLLDPQPVDGTIMLVVAVIGLVANLLTAALLFRDSRGSLNIRSAFLHIVSDAVSSVAVVLGGLLILRFGFYLVDPILTFAISIYILYHSYSLLRQTVDILMESTPRGLDLAEITAAALEQRGVQDLHHLHVWQIDETHTALEAHVVIGKQDVEQMEAIKRGLKQLLASRFDISHSTLEFEFVPCADAAGPDCYGRSDGVSDDVSDAALSRP